MCPKFSCKSTLIHTSTWKESGTTKLLSLREFKLLWVIKPHKWQIVHPVQVNPIPKSTLLPLHLIPLIQLIHLPQNVSEVDITSSLHVSQTHYLLKVCLKFYSLEESLPMFPAQNYSSTLGIHFSQRFLRTMAFQNSTKLRSVHKLEILHVISTLGATQYFLNIF